MHDIRFIRDNPQAFDAGLRKRNLAPLSIELLEIDKHRRAAITESESAQARRKALSRQVGIAKGKGEPTDALRLGRATDWLQIGEGGPTRGIGAVTLVVGEDSKTWLEMDSIEFQSAT